MAETTIFCKSDCQFAMNAERACSLREIQVNQTEKDSPQLVCGSYVKAEKGSRFVGTDMEKARRAGMEQGIRERLG